MGSRLGDVVTVERERIEPLDLGSSLVDHYSLPAFDAHGHPERIPAGAIRSTKFLVPPGSVLLSRLNPHISRVWLPRATTKVPALGSTEFMVLMPNLGVSREWLYFVLRSPAFQRALSSRVTGTSNSHQRVAVGDVLDIQLGDASFAEHHEAIALMTHMDEKIDSNCRVLRLLAGRADLMMAGVARCGPRVALGDVAQCVRGVSYRSADLLPSSTALVGLKCFARDGQFRVDGLKPYVGRLAERQVLRADDLVVACTDLTQDASILGRVVQLPAAIGFSQLAPSQDCCLVRPDAVDADYLAAELASVTFRDHCCAWVTGTTVLHVASGALPSFSFRMPTESERRRISGLAHGLRMLRDGLVTENALLAAAVDARLRDHFAGACPS